MIVLIISFFIVPNYVFAHHKEEIYEPLFKQVTLQYWHDTPHDWHLLSALAAAESSYRHDVVSYAGAIGLLQIMPMTWREIRRHGIQIGDDLTDPLDNVTAGGYYLRRMYRMFGDERRSEDDRLRVSLASYNAGAGNILKAQKLAVEQGKVGVAFDELAEELPRITGDHAAGTIAYSNKIVKNYRTEQLAAAPREVIAVVPSDTVGTSVAPTVDHAINPTVHIAVTQGPPTDWSQLIGLLYLIFSGGRKDGRE